jgi:hypothetical protein
VAIVSATSMTHALTRFTTDSSASESSPTESVTQYAYVLRTMMTVAAAIESHA